MLLTHIRILRQTSLPLIHRRLIRMLAHRAELAETAVRRRPVAAQRGVERSLGDGLDHVEVRCGAGGDARALEEAPADAL